LYWAYLGPLPAPLLPEFDIMRIGTLTRIIEIPDFQANWLQVVENNLDGTHVHILHQDTSGERFKIVNTTRGSIDSMSSLEYWEVPFGIFRKAVYFDGSVQEDTLVFPNTRRRTNEVSVRVPVDDEHTMRYTMHFDLAPDAPKDAPVEHYRLSTNDEKDIPGAVHPVSHLRTHRLQFQDFMVMETQGAVTPRDEWHMGTSDRAIALLHEILHREMDRVEQGLDPKGVIRDPALLPIETQIARIRMFRDHAEGVRVYPKEPAAACES
jgi:5,5'-dehydrodivanillate O-demethylase oxygenase subunit